MINPQNQTELLTDFRSSWLESPDPDHFGEYEESEKTVDSLIQAIIKDWSGTDPIFLLEPILRILLKNKPQFDNQNLEDIKNGVIKFLENDESFNKEVNLHLKSFDTDPKSLYKKSLYKKHPILRHFVKNSPINYIFLGIAVLLLGLGGIVLWRYLTQPLPIFSLCESDFRDSKADINCGDEKLSNFSKLSSKDMEQFLKKLQEDFEKDRAPKTLIALNNATILQALKSGSLNKNNIYPIGVAIPLSGVRGAVEVGNNVLSGIAKKQDEFNNISDQKLFVILADDQNNQNNAKLAEEIAKKLGKNRQILGVIGPYSSSNLAYVLATYTNNQLPLISPTATAAMKDLIDVNTERGFSKLNTSFFFRTSEDTDASIKISLEYLKSKGYKQLIIFCDDQDIFSFSLLKRLREQTKKDEFSMFSIVKHREGKDGDFISIRTNENFTKITQDLIKKYRDQKATTAIFYLQGAHKDQKDIGRLKAKIVEVFEENQGEFLIVGSNTVRQPGLLKNNAKILKQIVVMQPWFPLKESIEFDKNRGFWKSKDKSEDIVNWNYVMAYDATQVLLYAIANRKNKNEYPTKQEIQQVLTSNSVQNEDCANKTTEGITDEILTTKITFNGSDRCPNGYDGYVLIKPIEIKSGQWEWQAVNKNTTQ